MGEGVDSTLGSRTDDVLDLGVRNAAQPPRFALPMPVANTPTPQVTGHYTFPPGDYHRDARVGIGRGVSAAARR